MPTSELSNALQYVEQPRNWNRVAEYGGQAYPQLQQVPQQQPQQQQHVQAQPQHTIQQRSGPPESLDPASATAQMNKQAERNLMLNLWKVTVSNREAQEAETKRRQDWERQIEEKQADTDQKIEQHIGSVNEQLSAIRSLLAGLQAAPTPTTRSPAVALASPVSPAAQPQAFLRPAFLQGSSTNPFPTLPNFPSFYHTSPSTSTTVEPHSAVQYQNVGEAPPSAQTYTPDPSPQLTSVEGAKATNKPPPSASQPAKKKRRRKTDTSDAEASSDSESEVAVYPRKRKNHHDTECYTLHHAMRIHVRKLMDIVSDKCLPDSHVEGTPLLTSEPIRFVWDKTTKQSIHNLKMRDRVVEDIQENRLLYKNVPQKEFTKRTLEHAFDQCFTTLRQKYKAQKDERIAIVMQRKEDDKARKSRHTSRRKFKLDCRVEARKQLTTFHNIAFDPAFQIECMSSEDSDSEEDPDPSDKVQVLITRGDPWRSSRLLQLYHALDEHDKADMLSKPKRGGGRKERKVGPLKEGPSLPPPGVAKWMISKRWLEEVRKRNPEVDNVLKKRLVTGPGVDNFDWDRFTELGDESGDENDSPSSSPSLPPPQTRIQTTVEHHPSFSQPPPRPGSVSGTLSPQRPLPFSQHPTHTQLSTPSLPQHAFPQHSPYAQPNPSPQTQQSFAQPQSSQSFSQPSSGLHPHPLSQTPQHVQQHVQQPLQQIQSSPQRANDPSLSQMGASSSLSFSLEAGQPHYLQSPSQQASHTPVVHPINSYTITAHHSPVHRHTQPTQQRMHGQPALMQSQQSQQSQQMNRMIPQQNTTHHIQGFQSQQQQQSLPPPMHSLGMGMDMNSMGLDLGMGMPTQMQPQLQQQQVQQQQQQVFNHAVHPNHLYMNYNL